LPNSALGAVKVPGNMDEAGFSKFAAKGAFEFGAVPYNDVESGCDRLEGITIEGNKFLPKGYPLKRPYDAELKALIGALS